MEEKKRTWFAVLISCVILLAVGYGFALNFFRDTAQIVVADPSVTDGEGTDTETPGGSQWLPVEVTPQTVQSIIADMDRYQSYQRTVEICYFWGEGEASLITASVVEHGGWLRCETRLPGELVEHSILGNGTLWYWYDEGPDYLQVPASEGVGDLIQRIPTYEDILLVPAERILRTGYEETNGVPCIFVEVEGEQAGVLEQYWVSTAGGLLVAARREENGRAVYTMTSGDVVRPGVLEAGDLTLPDGTVAG